MGRLLNRLAKGSSLSDKNAEKVLKQVQKELILKMH